MLEGRDEAFPTSSDVLPPDDCVNSKKSNGNNSIDTSIANCKNNNLPTSTKSSNLSTSFPTMIIDEEKESDDTNSNMLNPNISEYSMEMLALLTSSTMTALENHNSDNVKNGTTKKRKSKKFKPSNVWKHFLRLSDGNVRCVHCGKILKRKDSSTKTMWGHLRAIHFKGGDWTILQQQQTLRDRNRIEMLSLDELDPSGIITTQNWLEQRVGILGDKSQESQSINERMVGQLDESSADSLPWTPTQPYIKRNRSSSFVSNGCITNLKNIDHKTINDCTYNGNGLNVTLSTYVQSDRNIEEKSLNFLSSIPH
ncbi:unnamed protein product, partial [Onchocerca flexuosa]|uniref:BED-type domain-containing protein n=1 Tax=Onchocerca flexuosa TaxID=387005 RepID=A0A183I644_9BILA